MGFGLVVSSVGAEVMVLAVLLITGVAIAFGIWLVIRMVSQLRVDFSTEIERLDAAGLPAILSHLDGRVIHQTERLLLLNDRKAHRVEDVLSGVLEGIEPKMLYRLSRASSAAGFAVRPVRQREDGLESYLTCTRLSADLVVWSVLTAEDMRGSFGEAANALWGMRALPALHLTPGGKAAPTDGFLEEFGSTVSAVLDQVGNAPVPNGARVTLTTARREVGAYRVFSLPLGVDGTTMMLFLGDERGNAPPGSATVALDTLPVALMQFDLEGRFLWLNQQASQILGEAPAQGTEIDKMFSALGRPIPALIEEAMSGAASRRGAMVRLDGQKPGGFLQITLIRSELDGIDGLIAVLNDANELRELEDRFAQSQKMEAVGKLAGGVAHDFNNVLTAIKGHCDFVLMGKEQTHPDYEDLVQIRQNSNRAASMVRHLLAFSRQQTLQPQMLNLRDVISDAHVFLNSVIGEKVVLHIDHERELWPVMADQHQLEQVLMNLVVNARDAMEEGGTVTVATRNVSQPREEVVQGIAVPPGSYVEISVTDDGTGIPEDVIDRVFDPFFTTKPQGQGTGLGLSTVYGIVKQSGGFIFAQNLNEGGACFRLMLPCASPSSRRETAEAPAELRRDLTGQATVLLVEDEDSIRSVGSRALKLRGYRVHEAASAEDAMKLLSEDKITVDVLVSDVVMPGMDGPTFAVQARAIRPGLRLIFVSGYAEDNFKNAELGDDFLFLPKPFSINELTAKVKEALDEAA
ncbi:MAG: ATP-binding protein [Pseudomonadota bacterium]